MAYVALYRAYRPQKFSEVVGQEHIIKTLQNAIKLNKVAHAYLFCGPRGTGKTTLAKILAKALNCENGPTIEPCCECDVCKEIAKGTLTDVIEIDAASNNGADDIRALRETVNFLPSVGKYKVYIIDEVHMLSQAAFNALLKTLEEPPKHVIFVLATTEPYKLPNTILSRCQRFDFQSIKLDDILKRLRIVANEENIKVTDDALFQIASAAEGGMRDALSIFDQTISYSQNEEVTLDDVLKVSGNVSYLKIIELLSLCRGKNETDAIKVVDEIIKDGKEVPRIINDIIMFLRDVLLFKNNIILDDRLMFKNEDFAKLCNNLSKTIIYSWLDILNDALIQMKFSIQKRSFLELAILKMNDYKLNEELDVLDRVEFLEKQIALLNDELKSFEKTPKKDILTPVTPQKLQPIVEEIKPVEIQQSVEQKTEQNVSVESQQNVIENNKQENVDYPDEINIKDIEEIINNASKAKKEMLSNVWLKISEAYSSTFAVQILVKGTIVAVSDDSFVIELKDVGFCNRLMSYENYVKIMDVFKDFNIMLKSFICVPEIVWSKIILDYKSKYSKENPKPHLSNIRIGVKKTVFPKKVVEELTEDEKIEKELNEFFDKDELNILE